ncbi:MAG TPA: Rieske 2Fe-2S domain-containing protein [Candidatus Acidoferrales bacterium]|nr:Rieske 2Fe-2S domain-containing protein [Candidatus Acidoferrales bacterium]
MTKLFHNPDVAPESWYLVARSREIAPGKVICRELLNQKIAVYRGQDGRCDALYARCPHLGANLAHGDVVGNNLRCAFHHWTFNGGGECVRIPYKNSIPSFARVFSYPVEEKYGAAWIFNGPRPLFSLPTFSEWREEELLWVFFKPRVLSCHPHLLACNGLDVQHFKTVHELDFVDDPVWDEPSPFSVRLRLKIRLGGRSFFERAVRLFSGETVEASFTTLGGNLAMIEGSLGRFPLLVLFTHRPLSGGRSASQTILFAPKRHGLACFLQINRALLAIASLVMGHILVRDRKLLEEVDFRANLVESDAPLGAFIRQINKMEVFDAGSWERVSACRREEAL